MSRYSRIVLLALIFAATDVVLTSAITAPALAQKSKQQEQKKTTATKPGITTNTGASTTTTTGKTTVKVNVKKPTDSVKANREHACGNDQNKCYGLWQEMTFPHDNTYPARLKVERAYRDCMAKCIASPGQRK